ncbi:hypothetical protein BD410DRAFT_709431 [Rickenella mellea]|uniref:Proline-rich protein n=1 Tax=Rickenella mellea TaxID=50990 RepID=A0A4R5XDV9_9AGAM|nr:hypothetical protein BD410DRAFT_709431 [Rickenella mellea]
MVQLRTVLFASLSASVVLAAPLHKRIDQITSDGPAAWATACTTNGGGSKCGDIKQQAAATLLAAGKNCDQQDAADAMVDLSKTLKNNTDMIRLAQLFVQQPRNAPEKLQVPYCQKAPKNKELNGLFHCQFSGSDFTKFSGDQTGNLPLGVKAVNPPGSCPAKKDGPVPDGVQLNTLVTDPGVGSAGEPTVDPAAAAAPADNAAVAAPVAGAKPFTLQNGKDAQALNKKFATLTADTACTTGDDGCINGQFAQCVGGKFAVTGCAGGTKCFALPLVNKAGTSITCSTDADATSRIANTGATGGITGA